MTTGILMALITSLIWISLQIIWMHIRPAENRFRAMLLGFLSSLPLLGFLLYLPVTHQLNAMISAEPFGLVVFNALLSQTLIFFCYVECFYHIERAVTFRMLIEIADHPAGIPIHDLKQNYNVSEMISARMNVLRERGFVYEENGRWHLMPKGILFAGFMRFTLWLYSAKSQKERD